MINPQFIEWIQEQINKGWTVEQLRSYLLSINYAPADIDEAINSLNKANLTNPPEKVGLHPMPIKSIIIGSVVLFIIIGIFFVPAVLDKTNSDFVLNNEELNTGDQEPEGLKTSAEENKNENIEDTINEEAPKEIIPDEESIIACNNNVIEDGETCDGITLNNKTCVTEGFDTGNLACKSDCSGYDTTSCVSYECGNSNNEGNEICDGTALNNETCITQGFSAGTLICKVDCSGYDTSSCVQFECGNNNKEGNEVCDGTALNSKTCITQGFNAGTLICKVDCSGYDTSSCVQFECGNNNKEGNEVCDGTALNGKTCATQGFNEGTLACKSDCSGYDTANCVTFECGNNNKEGNEVCDGTALNSKTCVTQGFDSGILTCETDCSGYDTTSCENDSEPELHELSITSSGYSPSSLTINVGDTVRWTNQVTNPNWPASDNHPTHTTYPGSSISKCGTAEASSIFDSCEGLSQGETYSFTFNSAGTWDYHNHLNAGQSGTIIVQ